MLEILNVNSFIEYIEYIVQTYDFLYNSVMSGIYISLIAIYYFRLDNIIINAVIQKYNFPEALFY